VDGLEAAVEPTRKAAGDMDVNDMGGGERNVVRPALAAGLVDQLTINIAPLLLGRRKRLFEGFGHSLDLEHPGARLSRGKPRSLLDWD
jgi:dihydrofolate reductase